MAKLRPDQDDRLVQIEEKLMDVFLDEADPAGWMNEEKARELAAQQIADGEDPKLVAKELSGWKGQRYWEKKNANATMALLARIVHYRTLKEQAGEQGSEPGEDEKNDIAAAEKKVKAKLYALKKKAA